MSLSKTLYPLLSTGSSQEIRIRPNMVEKLLTSRKQTCTFPGVASSILALSHTFVEIDHKIISIVILLPSTESFMKGCCQLQGKVCAQSTGKLLVQACPGKSVVI